MHRHAVLIVAACALAAACGKPGVPADAQKTADRLTGDDKLAGGSSPECKAFKPAEIAGYIGEPVGAPANAASGLGCQWLAKDGSGDVIVAVVPADYHEKPSAQEGYRKLPAPGSEAFVAPYMGGWLAGAITGKSAVRVSTAGARSTPDSTIALLTDAAKRLGN